MTRISFFNTVAASETNLTPKHLAIRDKLLKVLMTGHRKEDLLAVFEEIIEKDQIKLLLELGSYSLTHSSQLDKLTYGLITHPWVESIWERVVKNNNDGQFSFSSAVELTSFKFNLTLPDYKPYSSRSEYLFSLLAGLLRATQAWLDEEMASLIRKATREGRSPLVPDPDSSSSILVHRHRIIDTSSEQNKSYFQTLLYYAYWQLRDLLVSDTSLSPTLSAIGGAGAAGASVGGAGATPEATTQEEAIKAALSTLRSIGVAETTSTTGSTSYFLTLTASLLNALGREKELNDHLGKYFQREADWNSDRITLYMAFQFYPQDNLELANHFLDKFISKEDTLKFSSLFSLKTVLAYVQLAGLATEKKIETLDNAIGHLEKRFRESNSTPSSFEIKNKVGVSLLLSYLYRLRASCYQEQVAKLREQIKNEWLKKATDSGPTASEWKAITTFLSAEKEAPGMSSDKKQSFPHTLWKKLLLEHWEKLASIPHLDKAQLQRWKYLAIGTDYAHPAWEEIIHLNKASLLVAQLDKALVNCLFSEESAKDWKEKCEEADLSSSAKALIKLFDQACKMDTSTTPLTKILSYYYLAFRETYHQASPDSLPSFQTALGYIAHLEVCPALNSAQKASAQLASCLIYLKMLEATEYRHTVTIEDITRHHPLDSKQSEKKIKEEKRRIYLDIIKKLTALYESNLLNKAHCIPRLLQQLYNEKLQMPTEAAVWQAKASSERTRAEAELRALKIKAEHLHLANADLAAPRTTSIPDKAAFSKLLDAAFTVAQTCFTYSVFQWADTHLLPLASDLSESLALSSVERLKEGVVLGNFRAISDSVSKLLEVVEDQAGPPHKTQIEELSYLGQQAAKYHSSLGIFLNAKIQISLAECFYRQTPSTELRALSLLKRTPVLKVNIWQAKEKFLTDETEFSEAYRQAMFYRSQAIKSYTAAEILNTSESLATRNALYGEACDPRPLHKRIFEESEISLPSSYIEQLKAEVREILTRTQASSTSSAEALAEHALIILHETVGDSSRSTKLRA